jgi:hypothetical protein
MNQVQILGDCANYDRGLLSTLFLTAVVSFNIFVGGCSSTAELSSSWNNSQIVVDGHADDWEGHFYYLKDSHVSLGIRNDQDYLYVCLMSSERQFRRQMIGLGLTVWLEPEDGKKWGIHYPIGFMSQGGRPSFDPEETGGERDTEEISEPLPQTVEIIGPGKDERTQFSVVRIPGISMRVESSQGSIVYELKVPLEKSSDHPYAINAGAGSTLKLGLETGKFEGRSREGGMRQGGRGDGERGGFGGRGRGGRPYGGEAGRGMASGERPEPLEFSAVVHLANVPSK